MTIDWLKVQPEKSPEDKTWHAWLREIRTYTPLENSIVVAEISHKTSGLIADITSQSRTPLSEKIRPFITEIFTTTCNQVHAHIQTASPSTVKRMVNTAWLDHTQKNAIADSSIEESTQLFINGLFALNYVPSSTTITTAADYFTGVVCRNAQKYYNMPRSTVDFPAYDEHLLSIRDICRTVDLLDVDPTQPSSPIQTPRAPQAGSPTGRGR